MRLHARHDQTAMASMAISAAVCDAVKQFDLTYAELVAMLAQEIVSWTKYQVREERENATD